MLDPEYLRVLGDKAGAVAKDLHDDIVRQIIKRIAIRLGRGDDFILTASDKYRIQTLQEAGYLLDDIAKEIADKTPLEVAEIKKAFEDGGITALKYDARIYEAVGLSTEPLMQSPNLIRILQRGYEATYAEWLNYTRSTAIQAQKTYINLCDEIYTKVVAGQQSYTEAYYSALKKLTANDLEVVYPSGHKDTIETATLRAVRTGVSQTTSEVTATRAAEMGVTCFLVSAHMGARPSHAEWQGKVFWIDWKKLAQAIPIPVMAEYPEASDEEKAKYQEFTETTQIGTVTGLCGANCRHSYGAYFDGLSSNPYENMDFSKNDEFYRNTQKQRAMERSIRKTKKAILDAETALKYGDDPKGKIQAQLDKDRAKLKEQVNAYYEFCNESKPPLKPQESRLAIAESEMSGDVSGQRAGGWNNQAYERGVSEYIGDINYNDPDEIKQFFSDKRTELKDANVEENYTVTADGKIWHTTGDEISVDASDIEEVHGVSLDGSFSLHNHLSDKTWYSFSGEDLKYFMDHKERYAEAFDDKYIYRMAWSDSTIIPTGDVLSEFKSLYYKSIEDAYNGNIDMDFDDYHNRMTILSKKYSFIYERVER